MMMRHQILVIIVSWFCLFSAIVFASSGFMAGTLVETPTELVPIEQLRVGDIVCCRNDAGEKETSYVAAITTSRPEIYAFITWGIDTVVTSVDQQFLGFAPQSEASTWIKAEQVTPKHQLLGGYGPATLKPKYVEFIRWHQLDDPPLLYALSVAGVHNYLITQNGITVHNFVLILPLLSFAFGAGGTATAITGGKLLLDTLIAGLFLTAVEYLYPGSTSSYEYTAQGNMYQVQGQGSDRGDLWHGNVDQQCRQALTPADYQRLREQETQAALEQRERMRKQQEERDNWTPAEGLANWITRAPAWWRKVIFGEQPKAEPIITVEVPPLVTPSLTLTSSPLEHEAVVELHTQFKQKQEEAKKDITITSELNKQIDQFFTTPSYAQLDPLFKQYVTQQAYEWLYSAGKQPTEEHLRVQLTIASALHELHTYELHRNPGEALLAGYEELALTLVDHAARAIISNDQHQVKGAIISAELCDALCNKQMLETKWMIAGDLVDQFGQPASASSFDIERTMLRTGQLLVEHGIETARNPLPLLGSVALTAACPPAALALFTADLVVHHKELFQSSKQFYQLLKDDTPEGAARLIAFCIELVALHKATQATSQVINAQMPRIKNAFDKIATLAAEEQTLALAGEATGASADTTYSSMLKNARNAAEEAIESGDSSKYTPQKGPLSSASSLKISAKDLEALRNPESSKFQHVFGGDDNITWSWHRFDKVGKTPAEVVNKMVQTVQAAIESKKIPTQGFFEIKDKVDGHLLVVRGQIIKDEIKIGTFFVDKDCC